MAEHFLPATAHALTIGSVLGTFLRRRSFSKATNSNGESNSSTEPSEMPAMIMTCPQRSQKVCVLFTSAVPGGSLPPEANQPLPAVQAVAAPAGEVQPWAPALAGGLLVFIRSRVESNPADIFKSDLHPGMDIRALDLNGSAERTSLDRSP